ncbi:hypothetical protein SAMN03159341_13112 [Paenibacillus sp. 1_12]|nr:hypothetical protein SAMN03159341_13112 [Paenibacillus sp. 1_12]
MTFKDLNIIPAIFKSFKQRKLYYADPHTGTGDPDCVSRQRLIWLRSIGNGKDGRICRADCPSVK